MSHVDPLRQQLQQGLGASIGDGFAVGPLRGDPQGTAVRWASVAALTPLVGGPVLEIGLTEHGRWVVAAADGSVVDVQDGENYLPLFPLLEMSVDEARTRLENEFKKRGVDENWIHFFPFDQLVAAALTSRSKGWSNLALRWLEKLGPSETLCAAVDLVRNTGLSQRLRHQAARILSSWRRMPKG